MCSSDLLQVMQRGGLTPRAVEHDFFVGRFRQGDHGLTGHHVTLRQLEIGTADRRSNRVAGLRTCHPYDTAGVRAYALAISDTALQQPSVERCHPTRRRDGPGRPLGEPLARDRPEPHRGRLANRTIFVLPMSSDHYNNSAVTVRNLRHNATGAHISSWRHRQ